MSSKNDPNFDLGIQLANEGKYSESISSFKKSLSSDPLNVKAWFNLALSLNNSELFKEALFAMEKTIELSPGDDEAAQCKSKIERNLLKLNLPIDYHTDIKTAFLKGLLKSSPIRHDDNLSNDEYQDDLKALNSMVGDYDNLDVRRINIGDKAWVWVSDRYSTFNHRVEITKISKDKICVKDLSGKGRRFRPFLAKKDYVQLSGSGRGVQTLKLKRVTGAESFSYEVGIIL